MDDQATQSEPVEATNDPNYFDLTGSMHAIADALERLSDGGIAHLIEKIRREACKLDAALKAADGDLSVLAEETETPAVTTPAPETVPVSDTAAETPAPAPSSDATAPSADAPADTAPMAQDAPVAAPDAPVATEVTPTDAVQADATEPTTDAAQTEGEPQPEASTPSDATSPASDTTSAPVSGA